MESPLVLFDEMARLFNVRRRRCKPIVHRVEWIRKTVGIPRARSGPFPNGTKQTLRAVTLERIRGTAKVLVEPGYQRHQPRVVYTLPIREVFPSSTSKALAAQKPCVLSLRNYLKKQRSPGSHPRDELWASKCA